jgi:hypothetical protein
MKEAEIPADGDKLTKQGYLHSHLHFYSLKPFTECTDMKRENSTVLINCFKPDKTHTILIFF